MSRFGTTYASCEPAESEDDRPLAHSATQCRNPRATLLRAPNDGWAPIPAESGVFHLDGGPVTVAFTARLEPEGNQTRLLAAFDARPRGWFRLVFPLFYVMMKRQENANMVNCRAALERRLAGAGTDPSDSSAR